MKRLLDLQHICVLMLRPLPCRTPFGSVSTMAMGLRITQDVVKTTGTRKIFPGRVAKTVPPLLEKSSLRFHKTKFILEDFTMFEKLKELLVDELQIDEADITLDAELSGDLGINSIELADLVMLCEEKFNIEIEDGDLHKLVTVGDVVNYLESL